MLLGIRWNSMRAKIIAWSFVPTAIILMAVAWVTFVAYQHVTEDLVIERNQELTRLSTGEFAAGLAEYTGLLTGYTGLLADLARTAYIYENDPTALQTALTRARDRLRVFDGGVLVINSRGTVVATEPPRPETVGQNWSNRSYFRHMLRSPEPVFSDMVTDGLGGAEVIAVAVPIKGDQGQFLGIISGMFQVGADTPNPFYRDITMLRIGESESTFLVDGQGRVIYHSDADHIGDDFSAQTVVQQVSEKQIGALRTRDLEGQEIVASFAPVPGTPWGLVTEEGWGKLISPSQGYQRFLLLLLALGVMVPAAVVAIGVKRITKPIIELIAAAQEVAGGNFGQTITAHTGDEVEELAEQFNLMAAQLHESYARLEQRVDNRTKELAALNAIATSVSGSLALDEMLYDALDKTLHVMEVEAGGIYLLDHQTGTMTIAARRGFGPELADQIDRLKVGEGFSGHVAETGAPLVVKDVSSDPRLTRLAIKELGLRCLASVPLHAKGKVLGTLFAVTRGHHEFSEQDVQLLTSIGHQIGIAVENAQLFAQVEQRMQELEALFSAGAGLHRNLRLDEVLQALVDIAVDILQADKSSVLVWDEERERLVMRVARGFAPRVLHQLNFARGAGITGHVFVTGEPVIVEDLVSDPRCKGEPAQVLRVLGTQGIRSLMHLPIQVDGEIFGIFNVNWTEPHAFGSHEQRIFLALAQRAALAIENARLLDAERRQRQEATLLAEMAKLISGTLDLDEVLRLTAEYAVDVFSVHCCSMLLFDEQQGTLKPATQIGFSDTAANIICDVEFTPNESMQQTVFEALQPLIIEDAASSPHLSPPEPFDLQSVLVVPIEVGGRRLGAMQLGTQRPERRRFTADEGELALAMANHAAEAIENARLFKAERRRAEQFRVISEVGRRITSILAVDELLDQMARLVQEIFQYDLVSFGLIEGNEVVFEAGVGPVWNTDQTLRLKLGREGISGWVAQTGQPLLVPDVRNEPRYHFIPQAAETRSELCVPLKTKEAVIGVLDVQSHQLGVFDEIDLAVLQSLADQTAVAIESARLYRDATRQVRELRALADASRIISSKLDQDQLLQALYEQITRIAPTDFYAIALYDEATNIVSIEICVDDGVHYPKDQYVLDRGLLKLIIHNRQPLLFHSLTEEKHKLDVEIVPSGSPKVNHGWLGVPMLFGDKVLGAIVVGSYQRGAFDEGHQQTLTSIANQAAVALENARLYEQARQLAVMEERQRLARDLHDAVTQTLFSASLIAETLPALWESDQVNGRQLLQELRQLSRGALAEMRTLLLELRPKTLVEANLGDLLRQLAEAVIGRTGLPVTVTVDGRSALPSDVHVALYRIAQETLNNVVKHAQPSQVTIALHATRRSKGGRVVELRVTDDGRGFDPQCIPPDRLGLGIIRERAQAVGATLQIKSQPGRGTQVVVVWEEENRPVTRDGVQEPPVT
jgi:GAF domain-containing protein/HAMP domain-containing protein